MVIIDLHTGLRKSELLNLKKTDILLDRNVLRVEDGKGGDSRTVSLSDTAKAEIITLLEKQRGDYLFHDKYGRPLENIKKSFGSALKRARLEDVRFHDLRRTFGTD